MKNDNWFDMDQIASGTAANSATHIIENAPNNSPAPIHDGQHMSMTNADTDVIEATRTAQKKLLGSLLRYDESFGGRRVVAAQRKVVIKEVSDLYITYFRKKSHLEAEAMLHMHQIWLRQEATKLKAAFYAELAEVTGAAMEEIENIFEGYTARLKSPRLQELYASYVMKMVLDLMEEKPIFAQA